MKNTFNHGWTRMNTDAPHPACGHPLPIGWGEGQGEGFPTSGFIGVHPRLNCKAVA
jgi:hypothetical protein